MIYFEKVGDPGELFLILLFKLQPEHHCRTPLSISFDLMSVFYFLFFINRFHFVQVSFKFQTAVNFHVGLSGIKEIADKSVPVLE